MHVGSAHVSDARVGRWRPGGRRGGGARRRRRPRRLATWSEPHWESAWVTRVDADPVVDDDRVVVDDVWWTPDRGLDRG